MSNSRVEGSAVEVPLPDGHLSALLYLPPTPRGAVIIAHPTGVSRLAIRERRVAGELAAAGFVTLLLDLLTEEEEVFGGADDDVPRQADRLLRATRWLGSFGRLPLGYLGVGMGGAAALVASALEPDAALAIVSRASRPDCAGASLLLTRVPSLFLVDGRNPRQLAANRAACGLSPGQRRLEVVPRARPGDTEREIDRSTGLSVAWFSRWLDPTGAESPSRQSWSASTHARETSARN